MIAEHTQCFRAGVGGAFTTYIYGNELTVLDMRSFADDAVDCVDGADAASHEVQAFGAERRIGHILRGHDSDSVAHEATARRDCGAR